MKEKWIQIDENQASVFFVSSEGRCKRVIKQTNETIITNGYHNKAIGYMQFDGTYVHRLVAKAFVPNPDNLLQVDHINSNILDNRAANLRWVNRKINNSSEHSKHLRHKNCTSKQHKNKIIKATKDGQTKFFKNGYACAEYLDCSHVLVYNALNKKGSAKRAKGWLLEWVDLF